MVDDSRENNMVDDIIKFSRVHECRGDNIVDDSSKYSVVRPAEKKS